MAIEALADYVKGNEDLVRRASSLHQFKMVQGVALLHRDDTPIVISYDDVAIPAVMGVDVVLITYKDNRPLVLNVRTGRTLSGHELDRQYIKFLPEHCKFGRIEFNYY